MLAYWTTVAIALASILITMYQIRMARFQRSVELLVKLEDDFFAKKRRQRALAAVEIERGEYSEAENILDFFETVAMYTRRHALDRYMVWHTFYYWIAGYFEICKPHIVASQKEDPIRWIDLTHFVEELRRFDAKHRSGQAGYFFASQAAKDRFLSEEISEASG